MYSRAIKFAISSVPSFGPQLLDETKLDVSWISDNEIGQLTDRVMATPPEVVARIQALLPGGGQ